jgi:hypothetical protein
MPPERDGRDRDTDRRLLIARVLAQRVASGSRRVGYRAGFGGRGECGVLGARFEPHECSYLRVSVAPTVEAEGRRAPGRFGHARVGLPLEYVGGVLAGAFQEPAMAGPGTPTFGHAAVHEIDSSWEVFRLLAIGVVRLLGLPSGALRWIFCRDSVAPNRRHLVPTEAYSSAMRARSDPGVGRPAFSGQLNWCYLMPRAAGSGTHRGPLAESGTRAPSGDGSDYTGARCNGQCHPSPFSASGRLSGGRAQL